MSSYTAPAYDDGPDLPARRLHARTLFSLVQMGRSDQAEEVFAGTPASEADRRYFRTVADDAFTLYRLALNASERMRDELYERARVDQGAGQPPDGEDRTVSDH